MHDELVYEVSDKDVEFMISHLKQVVESKHLLTDYTLDELKVGFFVFFVFFFFHSFHHPS